MRIAVDFDNTIAASSKAIFELYQKDTKDYSGRYTNEHLWDFSGLMPIDYLDKALSYFSKQEFYDILEPIAGAVQVLDNLSVKHEIIIVTKQNPDGVAYKAQWIRNYLPFINRVVFLNQDDFKKDFIKADIIIDDKPECLEGFNGIKILFGSYGYNQTKDKSLIRAEHWYKVRDLIYLINKGCFDDELCMYHI